MEQKGIDAYPIRTEYQYGNFKADIAIGDKQEVAVEIKFSYAEWSLSQRSFINAKRQLMNYLENGAKSAYLICLDHQVTPDRRPLSKTIDIKEIGLVGEWKEISSKEIAEDQFLIATLEKST